MVLFIVCCPFCIIVHVLFSVSLSLSVFQFICCHFDQTIYFCNYFYFVADEWLNYLQPINFMPFQLSDEKRTIKPEKRRKKVPKHLNVTEVDQLRNYRCRCGRSYVEKGSLQRHKRYECGKEPSFKCTHCSYASHLKSNMNRHKRIHKSQ